MWREHEEEIILTLDEPMRRHFCCKEGCEHVLSAKSYYFAIYCHAQTFVFNAFERQYSLLEVEQNLNELFTRAFHDVHDVLFPPLPGSEGTEDTFEKRASEFMEHSFKTIFCAGCNVFLNEVMRR